MNIDQGLFKLDFADHHAVLGIPLDTDPKQIRKRYLRIARKLHPDSLRQASEAQKQQAKEILSKLVNPAYETLNQEKSAAEHGVMLKLKGQQLSRQPGPLQWQGEAGQKLASSPNPVQAYPQALSALAETQYDDLDQVLTTIGQISELNAIYLLRQGGSAAASAAPVSAPAATPAAPANPAPAAPARKSRNDIIESYLKRAEQFEKDRDFSRAILELREAVTAHPNQAACHAQLSRLYYKAGQTTMAKIHCKRALELNPNDKVAKNVQNKLGSPAPTTATKAKTTAKTASKPAKGGGLFGLFGKRR